MRLKHLDPILPALSLTRLLFASPITLDPELFNSVKIVFHARGRDKVFYHARMMMLIFACALHGEATASSMAALERNGAMERR